MSGNSMMLPFNMNSLPQATEIPKIYSKFSWYYTNEKPTLKNDNKTQLYNIHDESN